MQKYLVRSLIAAALACCFLGNADDAAYPGGCALPSLKSAEQLCGDTGGSWHDGSCTCSRERPNWSNGIGCFDNDKQCQTNSNCPGGYVCSQGKCVAGSCIDECPYQNARQCESAGRSSGYRLCGQFDEDPCVEWSPSTSTCPGGELCVDDHCLLSVIDNSDFERGSGATPQSWAPGAWGQQSKAWSWEPGAGRNGSHAISLNLTSAGDVWWQQRLQLTPRTPYTLYGWIRGENIAKGVNIPANDVGEVGATFSGVGTWGHSEATGTLGTYDWKRVQLNFLSNADGTKEIGCRLGYWGSHVTGKAFFDDLMLSGDDFSTKSGEHLVLHLEHKDIASIADAKLTRWLEHLDRAYEAYHELVGAVPFSGEKINVLSVRQYPGGWAVAGNPIEWLQSVIHDALVSVAEKDDWSFGILHEIGHDFDLEYRWVWEAEFFANIKLYYVVTKLNGQVVFDGVRYRGSELRDFYRQRFDNEQRSGKRTWGDSIVHRFIQISEAIGWEPFRQTFRYFNGLAASQVPSTRTEKFNLFVRKLGEYSGADVRGMFTSDELTWIAAELLKP